MAHYRTTIHSPWSATEAFDYMADFRNIQEWDPGVSKSVLAVGTSPGPDAEYDLKLAATTLRYKTLEYTYPLRTVLEAKTAILRSYDVIEVNETPTGCDVTYDATLELNGVLGLADPPLGLFFSRIGDKAADGMLEALKGTKVA